MKKSAILVLTSILVAMLSVTGLAADLPFAVSGSDGYFVGAYERTTTSTTKASAHGYSGDMEISFAFPIGFIANSADYTMESFKASDGTSRDHAGNFRRADFGVTYPLKGLLEGRLNLTPFGGYTSTAFKTSFVYGTAGDVLEELKLTGLALGTKAQFAVADQISVRGGLTYAPSLTAKMSQTVEGTAVASDEGKGNLLEFELAGDYNVANNLALELGYRLSKYAYKYNGAANEITRKASGIFGGMRYSF